MVKKTVEVTNPAGLHARSAALFVQTAGKYNSNIWVQRGDREANAKSIMGLMSLAISHGTVITIAAEGEDENLAVKELAELIASGFKE